MTMLVTRLLVLAVAASCGAAPRAVPPPRALPYSPHPSYAADDYLEYLATHRGESRLVRTRARVAGYQISPGTRMQQYELPRQTTGYVPVVVELGRMLEYTLQSPDVQDAFHGLVDSRLDDPATGVLVFDVQSYEFSGTHARVTIKVTYRRWGAGAFSKVYQADGDAWSSDAAPGMPGAMKTAVLEATKRALDDFLRRLIADLDAEAACAPAASRSPFIATVSGESPNRFTS